MFTCMYVCICAMYAICEGQKRAIDPLELKLQVVVRHLMWVLETKSGPLGESSKSLLTTEPSLRPPFINNQK